MSLPFTTPKKASVLISTLTLSLLLTACGQDKQADNEKSEQASNEKTEKTSQEVTRPSKLNQENPDYIISADPSNVPYEVQNTDGTLGGVDAEIINAIAEDQNFTYNFKTRKWQGIFKEIEENKSDLITGLVVASDDRRKKYDFTDPVFIKMRYAYLTKDTAEKNNVKEFKDICKLTVAVKDQTDKSKLYHSVCGKTNSNFMPVSSNYTAFENVVSGKADVAIGDDVLYSYLIKENKVDNLITIADPDNKPIILAWPTQKGNKELLDKFNAGLAHIKADGTYNKIIYKWLGDDFKMTEIPESQK